VVNVPVTLSNPYGGTVTVNWATADGTGLHPAVAPNDYTSASGTVTFLGGEVAKTVPVTIRGNASPTQFDEYDENFKVVLSSPTNATLGTNPGTVTILNDDTPTISLGNATINTVEGNSGTHTASVPVTLSNPSVQPITVKYATTPGSAVAPGDFTASSGTVTIPAGQVSGAFTVTIKGDTVLEDFEFLTVSLNTPGGGASAVPNLGNASEMVQILNDEKPNLTATAPTGNEGSTLQFGATLVQRYYQPITVSYVTGAFTDTALPPGDYTPVTGSLSFPVGTNGTQTVPVVTKFDFTIEPAEKFTMTWTSGSIKVSPVVKTGTIRSNHS
jgi:chitinase